MSRHRSNRTKDERFLVALYEMAVESGDMESAFNRYEVGVRATLNEKASNTICVLLGQANFIKKEGREEIAITSNGIKLAQQLCEE